MTTTSLRSLLARTCVELQRLRRCYEEIHRQTADPAIRMFASFLDDRERQTINALERYTRNGEDNPALEVHVRLGGFPFCDAPRLPDAPRLEDLIDVAEQSDNAIAHLRERVELYAASDGLHTILEALCSMIKGRRQHLAAAAREIEEVSRSPSAPHPRIDVGVGVRVR